MFYSVPYQYIKNKVDVRITDTTVEIFYNHNRIASHRRLYGRSGQYSTVTEHMPQEHQKYLDDIANKRKTMVSTGDRSAKIRTYNYPQGRITDHRINYTIYNLSAFMDGDIQGCLDQLIVAENAERLKESEL